MGCALFCRCVSCFFVCCAPVVARTPGIFLLCLSNPVARRACVPRCCLYQVVPHNIYLAMYSPSSVNVLAFDPEPEQNKKTHTRHRTRTRNNSRACTRAHTRLQNHGADQARGYAGKYCSKPEKSCPVVLVGCALLCDVCQMRSMR